MIRLNKGENMEPIAKRSIILFSSVIVITILVAALFLVFFQNKDKTGDKNLSLEEQKSISNTITNFSLTSSTFGAIEPKDLNSFVQYHVAVIRNEPNFFVTRESVNKTLEEKYANLADFKILEGDYTYNELDGIAQGQQISGYKGTDVKFKTPRKYFEVASVPLINVEVSLKTNKLSYVYIAGQPEGSPDYGDTNWGQFKADNELTFTIELKKLYNKWVVTNVKKISIPGTLSFDKKQNYSNLTLVKAYKLDYPKLSQYAEILECITSYTNC